MKKADSLAAALYETSKDQRSRQLQEITLN